MDNHIKLFKNHGKSIGYWEGHTDDGWVITTHSSKLDGKPIRNRYKAEGKNIGRANETSPEQQAELELASKARLKLDKGYVETLEAAQVAPTNTLGLPQPMLATPLEKVKPENIDWSSAYVQPKLDGHRALFKDGVLYSRQGKPLPIPHIVEAIKASGLDHLHLDGELYLHGKTLQELSRLIKKQTEDSLALEYHIYDIVMDAPFIERGGELARACLTGNMHIRTVLTPTYMVASMEAMMEHHGVYRDAGYEGTMLRFGDEHYRTGKRSRTLLKVKEFQDAEFRVVAYDEGKPYIKDEKTWRVPIWVCEAANGETFNVTAAGTMEEKHKQFINAYNFKDKLLTVKFHYLSKDGIPQLPVALRWHETV